MRQVETYQPVISYDNSDIPMRVPRMEPCAEGLYVSLADFKQQAKALEMLKNKLNAIRRLTWVACCWNDHTSNFDELLRLARRDCGFENTGQYNDWLRELSRATGDGMEL